MIRLELTRDEARRLSQVLQARLRDLSKEISRTEQLDFKESLRQTERLIEQIVEQLGSPADMAV